MGGLLALALLMGDTAVFGPPLWLAGHWLEQRADGRWTEERWGAERGGVMLGTSLSGDAQRATGFEYMRIATDEQGLAFWGSPGGAPPVRFGMIRAEATADGRYTIVFENPAHDFPTRVQYAREGDTLTATVSGPEGANAMSWSFRLTE
ncbi:MAG: hypothetical protein H7X93_11370 [Sphingomonadaceae bacterium]|nr:hypothetical protein [Sphingomonadaceae bacterium]